MHRYNFERAVGLRRKVRVSIEVEAESEAEARASPTKPDVER